MDNALWDLREKKTTFEDFLERTRKWYAGIPYSVTDKNQNGRSSECHPSLLEDGRVEFNKTANEATEQILTKDYAVRFAADPRPVWAVGLNISADRRPIESYEVVRCK